MVAGGVVLVGSYDGFLYALDLGSGEKIWRVDQATAISSVAVDSRVIFFGDFNGAVNAVSAPDDDD